MTTALSLSGGGSKGDFQLGAVRFLYRVRGLRPDIIIGTSVGSINGVKLAEGYAGGKSGLDGLEQIWLSLDNEDDMYGDRAHTYRLRKGGLGNRIKGDVASMWLLPLPLGIPAFSDLQAVQDILKDAGTASSLFHLGPIGRLLAGGALDHESLNSSGVRYYACTVNLNTGAIRYINQVGEVFERNDLVNAVASGFTIEKAVLASAAIPAVFEPQEYDGELYVDGGVREVIPIEACFALDANRVFAVSCGAPLAYVPGRDLNDNIGNESLLLDIGLRALNIAIDEVAADDTRALPNRRGDLFIVRPRVEVHDSLTVDPGLIRINNAYGWMNAFDDTDSRVRSSYRRKALQVLADTLTTTWRTKRDDEGAGLGELNGYEQRLGQYQGQGSDGPAPDPGLVQYFGDKVRQGASDIGACVTARRLIAGADSVPPEIDDAWQQASPRRARGTPYHPPEATLGDPGFWTGNTDAPLNYWRGVPLPAPTRYFDEHRQLWHEPVGSACRNFITSRYGRWGDYELVIPIDYGKGLAHYTRLNDYGGEWQARTLQVISSAYLQSYGAAARIQSASMAHGLSGASPGILEAVVRIGYADDAALVLTRYEGYSHWSDPVLMTANGDALDGATGTPALIVSTLGRLELFVPHDDEIHHYWRDFSGDPSVWTSEGAIYTGSRHGPITVNQFGDLGGRPSVQLGTTYDKVRSVSAIELVHTAQLHDDGSKLSVGSGGLFVLVFLLESPWTKKTRLLSVTKGSSGGWSAAIPLTTIEGATIEAVGDVGLIQSTFGNGNLELLVPHRTYLQHFSKAPTAEPWNVGAIIGRRKKPSGVVFAPGTNYKGVELLQGGLGIPGNFEAVALVSSSALNYGERYLQPFWFNSQFRTWHTTDFIDANGSYLKHSTA